MSMHIITDPCSFRLGKLGPSTGEIWLALHSVAFPAPHWNDFVVVILEAWASASLRLIRRSSDREHVHFMEGPYEVEMTRVQDGVVQLRALERGRIQKARATVPEKLLLGELQAAADAVISACREAGDTSIDAQRLERAASEMRTETANMVS